MTRRSDISILERELRGIFADRLLSLIAYALHAAKPSAPSDAHHMPHAAPTQTLAIVASISAADLTACANRVGAWHDLGFATPLVLTSREFDQSFDAFPLEFSAMLADHDVAAGRDPFDGKTIDVRDVRRACEVQARSHLLHLREGFLETRGNHHALAVLIVRSAAPFAALLTSVARLRGLETHDAAAAGRHAERELKVPPGVLTDVVALAHVTEISAVEAVRIFPAYLDAAERLVEYVNGWSAE